MHKIRLGGEADLLSSIQIARLALRHRQNKKQEQRIVLFVGSPVKATEKELSSLGGQLKKNKVAIDIVSFGEDNAEANQAKLEALHKAANNSDNCHIITIPPGAHMLSDALQRTPIVRGDQPDNGGEGGMFVDDNIDPELAEALRLSMLQAETDNKKREGEQGGEGKPATSAVNANPYGDDPELAEAMRLSMMGMDDNNDQEGGAMDEDDELAKAIALSRETAEKDRENDEKDTKEGSDIIVEKKEPVKETPKQPTDTAVDMSSVDPEYMSSLFLELPGIDPNDPEVMALLSKMKEDKEKEKKDEK